MLRTVGTGRGQVSNVSMKPDTADRWRPWRLEPTEPAPWVLARLAELDAGTWRRVTSGQVRRPFSEGHHVAFSLDATLEQVRQCGPGGRSEES